MKVVIMGCGQVGSQLAWLLSAEGHEVTILDVEPHNFERLPPDFKGIVMLGDGTREDLLRRAGIEEADAFMAVSQEDSHNIMAAQIAKHTFKVPKVICCIYDPLREELYQTLGLEETLCPTTLLAQKLKEKLTK